MTRSAETWVLSTVFLRRGEKLFSLVARVDVVVSVARGYAYAGVPDAARRGVPEVGDGRAVVRRWGGGGGGLKGRPVRPFRGLRGKGVGEGRGEARCMGPGERGEWKGKEEE